MARKDVVGQELDDELQHYLEMATRENVRRGMSRNAAERAARLAMGGIEATKAEVRAAGWEATVDDAWSDLRYAARALLRAPAFTITAVATLALGIGANTAMFSVVNAVMLRPLPFGDARRLVLIWTDDAPRGLHREPTAYRTISDWHAHNRTLQDVAFFRTSRVTPLSTDAAGERGTTRGAQASGNLFELLGATPLHGRLLSRADDAERAPVAVISHAFWQRWFGGASDIVGRTIAFDEAGKDGGPTLTIVGVMPPDFYFPDRQTEIWTPATTYWRFDRESDERFQSWARRWIAIARLAPHASIADARADLHRIGKQLAVTYPSPIPDFPGFGTTVLPVLDSIAGTDLQFALWVLLGAVALVLLVACANVANLFLARGAARRRELAVRRALGAGRGRLIRPLVAESLLLVIMGGGAGIILAVWVTGALATAAAGYLPRMDEIALDTRVLAFAALASIVAGLTFGIVPALRASTTDATEALHEGARGTASLRLRRSRGLLVAAECALAVVLLMGAGLLLRSLHRVQSADPGFDPRGVLTMRLEFASEAPPPRGQPAQPGPARARLREQQMEDLLARLRGIPGVTRAGFTDDLFIAGQGNESITIPGRAADQSSGGELNAARVSPDFFAVMRVPLRRGRFLTREDAAQKIRALWGLVLNRPLAEKERLAVPEPVVVNETFVRRFFPGEDPIGRRFCIDPTGKTYWFEIVGIVGDMRRSGLERETIAEFYGPYLPNPGDSDDLLVRIAGDPLALTPTIRREVQRAFPGVIVRNVSTADAGLGNFSAQRRLQTWLLTGFAALALLLAAVGVFGLVHYAVSERTREIGVRVALGATPASVLRLVIGEGMRMPAIGIGIGIAAALGSTRVLSHLLFGVGATDPLTFAAVGAGLCAVAVSACYIAARRAVRVDPVIALRGS